MKVRYPKSPFGAAVVIAGLCIFGSTAVSAQLNRSVDGAGNNLANPSWGAAHATLQRWAPACYPDSMGTPAGAARPSARMISNALFDQPAGIDDRMALSDFTWVFGQFMDHDISITADGDQFVFVPVPRGDRYFDPFNTGAALIPMKRSAVVSGTGTAPGNPRQHSNEITGYVDASNVYGSTPARAAWLRTFSGGKLKSSPGNLLPWSTVDATRGGAVDPSAPPMDNPLGGDGRLYVAGDVRTNENPLLATVHTVFMREHNRQCDLLASRNPGWSDEQLYQRARKLVGAIVQSIAFREWLPAMGVELPAYTGYRPNVNATVANEFGGAAFRVGHTLLNGNLLRLNADGSPHTLGSLTLRDAFFNVNAIDQSGGVDPFVQGMAEQMEQNFDARVLDDVRNFLFGAPGRGGLDLVSINIERGRERGLIDYNGFRQTMGLPRIANWNEVVSDPDRAAALDSVYGGVDDVDLWVGLLSEDATGNQLFGPTLTRAMVKQFSALRDGDRYFYLADPALSAADRAVVSNTRFSDVLRRNTSVAIMQGNVFLSMKHDLVPTCTATSSTAVLSARVHLADGRPLPGAGARLYGFDDDMPTATTDGSGAASFGVVPTCDDYTLDVAMELGTAAQGLTVADIYRVGQHVLGFAPITEPNALLAADVNRTGTITSFDMTNMRRVVLGLDTTFLGFGPWRVIADAQVVPSGAEVLTYPWRSTAEIDRLDADSSVAFTAIKVGDLNNSYSFGEQPIAPRSSAELTMASLEDGTPRYYVGFRQNNWVAHQYRLRLRGNGRILAVEGLSPDTYALSEDGQVLTVAHTALDGDQNLVLSLSAEQDALTLDQNYLNEAYGFDGTARRVELTLKSGKAALSAHFAPSLLTERTVLTLPAGFDASQTELVVTDVVGRELFRRRGFSSTVTLLRDELPAGFAGTLAYELRQGQNEPLAGILVVP